MPWANKKGEPLPLIGWSGRGNKMTPGSAKSYREDYWPRAEASGKHRQCQPDTRQGGGWGHLHPTIILFSPCDVPELPPWYGHHSDTVIWVSLPGPEQGEE